MRYIGTVTRKSVVTSFILLSITNEKIMASGIILVYQFTWECRSGSNVLFDVVGPQFVVDMDRIDLA